MAGLILPNKFSSQPQYIPRIDRRGIGGKARFALLGNQPNELVNGALRSGTIGANAGTPGGVSYMPPSTATTWVQTVSGLDPYLGDSFTLFWRGVVRANTSQTLLHYNGSGFGWSLQSVAWAPGAIFYKLIGHWSGGGPNSSILTVTDNTVHSLAARYNASAGTVEFFFDGMSKGSGSWSLDIGPIGAGTFKMIGDATSPHGMLTAQALSGLLSDGEISALFSEPWAIFKAPSRRIYVPSAAASGDAVGSASGTSAVSGVGSSDNAQSGSSAGIGVASGVGASINAQPGSSSGTSTVSGVGASDFAGVGSSSGTGTASGVGGADIPSVGSSSGTSTVSGVGTSSTGSFGTASGTSTVNGVGSSTVDSVGSAAGVASVSGVSASDASTVASASGSATVSGVGDSIVPGSAVGTASGSSSVSGVGASIVAAVGTADGSSVVSGKGSSTGGNVEQFAGGYISREERAERVRKKRIELGIIEEGKADPGPTLEQFEISNLVEKKAVTGPSQKKAEKRIIALEQERIRRNEELKRLIHLEIEREEEQIIRLLMEM